MTIKEKALERAEDKGLEKAESTPIKEYFVPDVDILEKEDSILLVASMPGTDENLTNVTIEGNRLAITAEVSQEIPEGYRRYYTEHDVGGYRREFTLSDHVDREGVTASVKNGILRLTLPKVKEAKPRKIQIGKG